MGSEERLARRNLFLTGFVVLFLELACIRWFAAYVIFLQFFTNIVLMAAFVGMSVGCLGAHKGDAWLRRFPAIATIGIGAALLVSWLYFTKTGFAVDVSVPDKSVVFFGTEARNTDLADFVVPIELLVAVFFGLVAMMFVGPGQVLGRALDAYPNRVVAYTLNIAGSLAGIACFSLFSYLWVPAEVWFAVSFAVIALFLWQTGALTIPRAGLLLVAVALTSPMLHGWLGKSDFAWSPYYQIRYVPKTHAIAVNNVGHQTMASREDPGPPYGLVQLLQRDAGGPALDDVMVIGAGSGNDLAWSLLHEPARIDAVEIDPVIQEIGAGQHPDKPYGDPRVSVHVDDGRNFLRTTDREYDLVTYALVDSLILHSSYSSIRLESYLFTQEAFEDVARVLSDDGVFVTYNYFRRGWIVQRIANMVEHAFGRPPLVLSFPPMDAITGKSGLHGRMTVIIAGNTEPIERAFAEHGGFAVSPTHAESLAVNGFTHRGERADGWATLAPTEVAPDPKLRPAEDDWPFLYVKSPSLPWLYVRGMVLVGGCAFILLWLLSPGRRLALDGRMFFLGAGFLLLETKAVVHLALVFGSTWLVNSAVFAAVLLMILGSNLYVLRSKSIDLRRHYAGLFLALVAGAVIPMDLFLGGSPLVSGLVAALLVMTPVFFAGVVFAETFRQSKHPNLAFGANIAGAIVGGLAEYLSMLVGFQWLLLIAAGIYALSMMRR